MDINGPVILYGDVHGSINQTQRAINAAWVRDVPYAIQLGDFGAMRAAAPFDYYLDGISKAAAKKGVTIYAFRGNHDNHDLLRSYPGGQLRDNVFFLDDHTQFLWNGYTVTIEGGAYSVDRQWRTKDVDYWENEIITDHQIQTALTLPQTDILLCHDSPTGAPNPVTDDPIRQMDGAKMFGYRAIEAAQQHRLGLQTITEHLQPSFIVHGHYHKFGYGVYNLNTGKQTTVLSLDEGAARRDSDFIYLLDPEAIPW